MRNPIKSVKHRKGSLGRKPKNAYTTKSGQVIKLNRSLKDRIKASRDSRARKRAERLVGMPKSRIKRFFFRLHPKRLYKYWFSREGLIMGLKISGVGIVVLFLLGAGIFAYFRKDLPNLRDISGKNIGGSVLYYDKTGTILLWEDVNGVKRIPVTDENISKAMKDAIIAVEDKDFYSHSGFDSRGILRAAVNNVTGGNAQQGASTITQQLVRLTQEEVGNQRTYTRKIKEVILAVEMERSYTKQEILVGYLNAAPFGGIEYGVEAAAQDYFNKSAKDLNLEESAMLASLPKSPTDYSPYNPDYDKEGLIERKNYILDLMAEQKMITEEQRDAAKAVDVVATVKPRKNRYDGIQAPWFVQAASEQLLTDLGSEATRLGGMKVITTLDMGAQKIVEEEVAKGLAQVKRQGGDTAAMAIEDVKTGQIVALVGGTDFNNPEFGQNNYARLRLPPGSTFKPYDYISLIEHTNNVGGGSVLYDSKGPLPGYGCTGGQPCAKDYDNRFPGPLTLRYALGGSRNIPAFKAMLTVGVNKTIETAEKLGLESGYNCYAQGVEDVSSANVSDEVECGASSAIGDGAYLKLDEHTHGFATISRNGVNIPRTYILKVEDSSGKTIQEWKPSAGEQVVRPDSAYIVANMMEDPRASYLPSKPHNYNGWNFGLKTGTTNDSKDGWMGGITTQYSAMVWVGHHTRRVEMTGFMENMTRPILIGTMQRIHDGKTPETRARPAGVQTLPAFVIRSKFSSAGGEQVPSAATDLYPSWYQKKTNSNQKQTIDQVSNKLATECTPERAKKETTGGDSNTFSADTFVTGGAAAVNTTDKDDVHKCDDVKPSISISVTQQGSNYLIGATVNQGTHALSSDRFPGTVNFLVDGQVIRSTPVSSSGPISSFVYTPEFEGTKEIQAQVIDSVLYDGSSSATITSIAASPTIDLTVSGSGPSYTFQWNTISSAASYQLCLESSSTPLTCAAATNPNGEVRALTGSNKKGYIKSNNGIQSDTESF